MSKTKHTQPPTSSTEIDLPEGWAMSTLGEIVSPSKEKVEPDERPDAPYLSLEHIESGTARIIGHGVGSDVASTKAVFRAGDVLYGKLRPYLNKVCIPDFDGICSTDILVFPKSEFVNSHYLLLFLMLPSVVAYANHNMSGVQLPRISFQKLADLDMPLAPVAEQKRIVAKVEALLERANAARERLARLPALLKCFRQSVLAAACCGQLTAEWREHHPGSQSPARRDVRGIKETNLGELPQDVDIPNLWEWRRVGAYLEDARYGTSVKCDYEPSGVPVLRVPNIASGKLDLNDLKYAQLSSRDRESLRLREGDVIICRTNGSLELVGKAAVFTGVTGDYAFASYLIRLRPDPTALLPAYLHLFLSSPLGRDQIEQMARTTAGQFNLNLDILRNLLLPLPAPEEQREIIHRVDALFALADGIEFHIREAALRAEQLPQAILVRAFRGELVPTEAELAAQEGRDYEPASVLLERVQEARKQHKPDKRGCGGKKNMTKRSTSRQAAMKSRSLDEVLREQGKPLTPEQLFDLAGFDESSVDGFYEQLRKLILDGKVRENRPNKKDVTLEAVGT